MVTYPDDLIDFLQIGAICLIGRDLAIPTFVNAKMPPRRCSSKEIPFSRHVVVSWDTRWHYTVTAPYTPHIHHTHHDSSPEIRLREALWQTYGITVSRRLVHQTEMLWCYMTLHRTGKRPHFIRCLTQMTHLFRPGGAPDLFQRLLWFRCMKAIHGQPRILRRLLQNRDVALCGTVALPSCNKWRLVGHQSALKTWFQACCSQKTRSNSLHATICQCADSVPTASCCPSSNKQSFIKRTHTTFLLKDLWWFLC